MKPATVVKIAILVMVLLVCAVACIVLRSRGDEECDRHDVSQQAPECGYWDDTTWILYPWVVPGVGGRPPAGKHPVPPAGVKPARPAPPVGVKAPPPAPPPRVVPRQRPATRTR